MNLDHRAILALAREEALNKTRACFPTMDWRAVDFYRTKVVENYINRISPITYGEVINLERKP